MKRELTHIQYTILQISRVIVGLLFIFSGLIKANDPLGFGYKLQEYFDVFQIGFLNSWSTGIALALCALEIILGALLLAGIYIRKVSLGLLITIIFFTFLTFVSAFFKVVTSCGCFGDAIPLTPWQSFSKDLILLILIVYIFRARNSIRPLFGGSFNQKIYLISISLASILFGIYTWSFLPVIDFLPYKIGANIPNEMSLPPGAPQDVYLIMYHMKNKKTGETKDISDADYLKTEIWKDNNWEIIGTPDKKLIKKGYEQKIKDLIITDVSGTNYTSEIIENPYYNLIVVAYQLADSDEKALGDLNALAINMAEQLNVRTVMLTSASADAARQFATQHAFFPEIFFADAVPLKSMVRANPGLILLKNGIVIDKWHHNSLPSFNELSDRYFKK